MIDAALPTLEIRRPPGKFADNEELSDLSTLPYPATTEVERVVSLNATVAFNRYSVPPGLTGATLLVGHPPRGSRARDSRTVGSRALSAHRIAALGAQSFVQSVEHRAQLEAIVPSAFSTQRPCEKKSNRPPDTVAPTEAAKLLGHEGDEVTVT